MSGPTHGGKGDARRPEGQGGAYGRGFDAIDWNGRNRSGAAIAVPRGDTRPATPASTRTPVVPDVPAGKDSA